MRAKLKECGGGKMTGDCGAGRSAEALAEWRSCDQVENGIPSTSPPYWDTDDDNDCGPKPSELYGTYTWNIDKFSEINKRELRSIAFEVGGYKWYILIYPQGCDACNHLSLFLCVANHDKLLPGWSHYAQFTIVVVNKDPTKSKYSDTLHRFWKKEHDWGWKKFMELSKMLDGFIDGDNLIIRAQVQVIRERVDRPFHCLDCQYRRELIRVYLTNVEQICRRFVEERRSKLGKLIEDKARWSSFCAFWLGTDQNTRCRLSKEKTNAVLKFVVKHFFIEKEVTSTLVMDSLYSGLKALEGKTKSKKARAMLLDAEKMPVPIVLVEKDTFVLGDDVLSLLERAAVEPLPPKDEKGPQNRTKDGGCGEDFDRESSERDERRLTELGRRTIEIFVLVHIFSSKIEVAYQEAVALKRQEELIREEEAGWLAETEQKAKRGAAEKETKSKKKQGKQKRNSGKGKDKGRDEKNGISLQKKLRQESPTDEGKDLFVESVEPVLEKPHELEDVCDVSDSVDCDPDVREIDSDERDASPVNWDTETSEVHLPKDASSSGITELLSVQNGVGDRKSQSLMDDSSSTCSTDSVPSVVMNGPYKRYSVPYQKSHKSRSRRRNQRGKVTCATNWANGTHIQPSDGAEDVGQPYEVSGSCKLAETESEAVVLSLPNQIKQPEQHLVKKEEVVSLQRKPSIQDQKGADRSSKEKTKAVPTSLASVLVIKPSPNSPQKTAKATSLPNSSIITSSKPNVQTPAASKPTEKATLLLVLPMSRPLSAPIVPGPRPTASVVSTVQTTPSLARSVIAASRLGPDPSPSTTHLYVPQSYRNVIVGNSVSASLVVNSSPSFSQPPTFVSTPLYLSHSSERVDPNSIRPSFTRGVLNHDAIQNGSQWMECPPVHRRSHDHFLTEFPATSACPTESVLVDEFPHLDIINDLLEDEHGVVKAGRASPGFGSFNNGPHYLDRQFSLPGDIGMLSDVGPLTGSCRFERMQSYHDYGCLRSGYGSSGGPFELLQANQPPYVNGQIDGLMTNQWQMGCMRHNTEGDGYPYRRYPDLACGVNGTIFWPSNGH